MVNVAVPENARSTVTGWADGQVRVAVTVATPPASAMGLPLRLKVTLGGPSSSMIVPVPVAVERMALAGLERLTAKVSFNSSTRSPLTETLTVLLVSPGLKVRVVVGMAT